MGSTRIARTAGEYRLSGDTADMVTLMRNGTEIAAVIRCGKRDGWWHDATAPVCAEAVILPGCKSALLALTAGHLDAANAILAMLPAGGTGEAGAR